MYKLLILGLKRGIIIIDYIDILKDYKYIIWVILDKFFNFQKNIICLNLLIIKYKNILIEIIYDEI